MAKTKKVVRISIPNEEGDEEVIHKITYDPFKHRDLTISLSDSQSIFTLIKSTLGTGIMAMPLAFSCAGTIVGTVGSFIIGYICIYCSSILVQQSQMMCRVVMKPSLTYGETIREAFAHGPKPLRKYAVIIKVFSDMAMSFTYLGTCCVYVSLMVNSIEQIIKNYFDVNLGEVSYCFIIMIPLVLLVQIRHLNQLTPLAIVASLFLLIVCLICLYFFFNEGVSFDKTVAYENLGKLPLFISTVLFAIVNIGIVLPVENRMENPTHFNGACGVLNISMISVLLLYVAVGIFGYAKFGNEARGAVTLNLDGHLMVAEIAKLLQVVGVLFTYPLQFFVASAGVWYYVQPEKTNKWFTVMHSMFLTLGVLLTVIVAAVTPKLEGLMEFVGSVGFSTFGLLFPAMIETIFMWDRDLGAYKWKLWKNILIGVFALVALACGVNDSINNIN